ncbi:MAG: hypothetical protein AAF985_13380 [Bacteroidota bacterium]
MKNGDDLHKLIHSLSKAEKRYFKMQAVQHTKKEQNNYVLLFDAIERQSVYNEDKLCRKLSRYAFSKNLSKTKYLLFELILRTMQQLHLGRTVRSEIAALLESIELLYRKTNYEQTYNLIIKAKKLALKNELYPQLLSISNWERRVHPYLRKEIQTARTLIEQYRELSRKVDVEHQYTLLFEEMQQWYDNGLYLQTSDDSFNRFKELASHQLLSKLPEDASFLSSIYYYRTRALIAVAENNFSKALTSLNTIKKLWERHVHLINIFKEEYVHSLTSYFIYSMNAKRKEVDYASLLDSLRVLKSSTKQEAIRTSFLICTLDFMHSLTFENRSMCKLKFLEVKDWLEAHPGMLSNSWMATVQYYICIFHFLTQDYVEALEVTEQLKKVPQINNYPHILSYCKLIGLMACFEEKRYDELEIEIRKTYRHLKKRQQIGAIEKTILTYTRKLLNAQDTEINGIFSEFHVSLCELESSNFPWHIVGGTNAISRWVKEKLPKNSNKIIN